MALAADPSFRITTVYAELGPLELAAAKSEYHPKLIPFYSVRRPDSDTEISSGGGTVSWDTGWGVNLGLQAEYSDIRYSSDETDTSTDDYSVELELPVGKNFGRLPAKVILESAALDATKTERGLEDARQRTILDILSIYYDYLKERKRLEVACTALEKARKNLDISEMKYRLGEVSRLDTARARQRVQQSQIGEVNSRNNLFRITQTISSTYGIVSLEEIAVTLPGTEKFKMEIPEDRIRSILMACNTAIINARDELTLAELNCRLVKRQMWPSLNLSYRAGTRKERALGDEFRDYQEVYLNSDLDIDISKKRLDLHSAKARVYARQLTLERLINAETGQLTSELAAFKRKNQLIDIAEDSLTTARSQVEVADLRFQRGIGSAFDVVDSQIQLQNSELQFLTVRIDYIMSYYEILYRIRELDLHRLVK